MQPVPAFAPCCRFPALSIVSEGHGRDLVRSGVSQERARFAAGRRRF